MTIPIIRHLPGGFVRFDGQWHYAFTFEGSTLVFVGRCLSFRLAEACISREVARAQAA